MSALCVRVRGDMAIANVQEYPNRFLTTSITFSLIFEDRRFSVERYPLLGIQL